MTELKDKIEELKSDIFKLETERMRWESRLMSIPDEESKLGAAFNLELVMIDLEAAKSKILAYETLFSL